MKSAHREKLTQASRVVVKIGSALLTNDGKGLNRPLIADWVGQVARLKASGVEVVLVSSGAVAEGVVRQQLSKRPERLPELQAAAAIGQTGLIEAYQAEFSRFDVQTGQILLVHDDIVNEQRFLNAEATLKTLLGWGAVPVVNENDSVASEELQFGDNDTLAAMVANIVEADLLVILTDQEGMFTADPRNNPDARLIDRHVATDDALLAMAGGGGVLGRGGMHTKVKAAQLASCTDADTVIVSGLQQQVLLRVLAGEDLGTLLYSDPDDVVDRKAWFRSLRQSMVS